MLKRTTSVSMLLCLSLCLVACTDKQLKQTNQLVLDYAAAITVAEKTVIGGAADQLIQTNDARAILKILDRANTAGQQVKDVLASIETLDPVSRGKITAILIATSADLDPTKISEVVGIKNPTTKTAVSSALVAIRSVISSIMIATQTNGG